MTATFFFEQGNTPLLISIPHDGRDLAPGLEERMSDAGRSLPDTDWHVRRLYSFARGLDASVLAARFSRYVVDLNRPPSDAALYDGQLSTGLCPSLTFAGANIYVPGESCGVSERRERTATYWQPYHDMLATTLTRIRRRFGYALLWDAHSIRSEVPTLFRGVLPAMSIGTNDGASCDPHWLHAVLHVARESDYSVVLNDRFKGGYITRHYGNPGDGVHAIQLELAQRSYMDEQTLRYDEDAAARLRVVLRAMLNAFLHSADLSFAQ
ncbi:MAG: N-formylglutamate deformylase [Proteobacteria bacterium]|nr:N-formylglutamate deformylase [Pseudomonadota bacterium]MYJ94076.1 N-formylglutamate deformylase [Pseudomonadota bacterium]